MKYILPYKSASAGAKALAQAMNIKMLRTRNSQYRHRAGDIIICWGNVINSLTGQMRFATILNHPRATALAVNKLTTLQMLTEAGVPTPQFTTDREVALEWLQAGHKVVVRTVLDGSEGQGIIIATTPQELVQAPLYTMYVKKSSEWRVHVVNGRVIATHRKVLREGTANPDFHVRNTANGFVFQRNLTIPVPPGVREQAVAAIQALGLGFGAVDVIYNSHLNQAFVLEANTAPGVEGQTVQDYAREFNSL